MRAFIVCFILISISLSGCKSNEEQPTQSSVANMEVKDFNQNYEEMNSEEMAKEEKAHWRGEGNHRYDASQTLYFSHAFIYEYKNGEDDGEFWIYHNPENGQLLYVPEDPMVEFVVSDTLGNYYFFGNDGHGVQTVNSQFVEWVAKPDLYDPDVPYPISDQYVSIKPSGKSKSLDEHSAMDGQPIVGKEYIWEFSKVSGAQSTYITEMIPVNFYQVYGFNKLEGDISLPVIDLDFTGVFGKNQTVTNLESEELKLALVSYQFNPYFVEAGDYEYSVRQADGSWKPTHLPLLSKK